MLGLPKSTERNKAMPKKAIFNMFKLSTDERSLFDSQISRLLIAGEISKNTLPLNNDNNDPNIFIVQIILKTHECDNKNILLLSKLIPHNMLFALMFEDMVRLAVYRAGKVFISDEKPEDEVKLTLAGSTVTDVWENIIEQISGIEKNGAQSLDTAIALEAKKEKLLAKINSFDKKARKEKQHRRKLEYFEEMKRLKKELETLGKSDTE